MFPEEIDNKVSHIIFTQNIHNDEPAVRLSAVCTVGWDAELESSEFHLEIKSKLLRLYALKLGNLRQSKGQGTSSHD